MTALHRSSPAKEIFLQRSMRVITELFASPDKKKPKELWGMPKLVWAVLATVLPCASFLPAYPLSSISLK